MTSWVHRYTLRELMDDSFDLFKERALDLMIAGLIPWCLVAIYWVLIRTFVFPGNLLTFLSWEKIEDLALTWEFWVFIVVGMFLVMIPFSYALTLILQCRVAARYALGEQVPLHRHFRLLAKPFFSLYFVILPIFGAANAIVGWIVGSILGMIGGIFVIAGSALTDAASGSVALAVVGGILTAIGVVLAVGLQLMVNLAICVPFLAAPVSLAYDHAGPFAAIGKSFHYAFANFKAQFMALAVFCHAPLVLYVILISLGALVAAILKYFAPYHFSFEIILTLVSIIFAVTCSGLLASLQALMYVDGRCRRDALDLQLMAADVGLGEEFARLYAVSPYMRQQYPNYNAAPHAAGPAAPQYGAPPVIAYPDYSAPPPPLAPAAPPAESAAVQAPPVITAPAATAYPDYSAPPPPLEPAAPPPAPPAAVTEAAEREGADVP
ncbi:MAG: hypothetical protein ACYDCO_21380 [Armatimonadota bacterium]